MRAPHLSRLLPVVLALAALLAGATLARASVGSLLVDGSEFHAGESVEVRWTGLPPECDELELLLSVDGGRTWPLRVSAELEPREGGFRWRVPNLAAGRARLRLRYGLGHRELDGPPTGTFRIVADPGAPASAFRFREGDWWERFESAGAPRAGALTAPRFTNPAARAACAPPRAGTALREPVRCGERIPRAASAPPPPARAQVCPPLVVPLRS
jgi:hypothetical protein